MLPKLSERPPLKEAPRYLFAVSSAEGLGLPLRQTTGFVANLLERVGLDWSVPDFSPLCRPLPGSTCLHVWGGRGRYLCHPVQGLIRAAAPADSLSLLQAATAGQWKAKAPSLQHALHAPVW